MQVGGRHGAPAAAVPSTTVAGIGNPAPHDLGRRRYTDVTWDIGACIEADGTRHLVIQSRKRRKIERNRCGPALETHRLLHHACSDAAREPGHIAKITRPATWPRSPVGKTGPGQVPKRR